MSFRPEPRWLARLDALGRRFDAAWDTWWRRRFAGPAAHRLRVLCIDLWPFVLFLVLVYAVIALFGR